MKARNFDGINKVERDFSPLSFPRFIRNFGVVAMVVAIFAIAIGFNLWLDHGCKLQGIITTHGKVCL